MVNINSALPTRQREDMRKPVHALFKYAKNPYGGVEIDTTSSSGQWRDLSPFVLGPIDIAGVHSENFENLWQFSKVYPEHLAFDRYEPSPSWFIWRQKGFADKRAHRYPLGKGRKPAYSWWSGEHLGYIEARKTIYAPIYAQFVKGTDSYQRLRSLYQSGATIVLRDYDAYDHIKEGMTLVDVLNNPDRKSGHAFILAMMLQKGM